MRKKVISLAIGILAFAIFPSKLSAGLLVIDQKGNAVWKILSYEDDYSLEIPRHSSLEVKKISEEGGSAVGSVINLLKEKDKISLLVASENETREVDVSGVSGDLVVVEERPDVEQITVGVEGNKFSLQQEDIKAYTEFPVKIDSKTAELSLKTQSGERFLSILPIQAVETLIRAKVLTNVKDNKIELVEEDSELQYLIEGEKKLGLLDVFNYSVFVRLKVSASTGEILKIEAPVWYKVVAFLVT